MLYYKKHVHVVHKRCDGITRVTNQNQQMQSDKCGAGKLDPDSTAASASDMQRLKLDTENQMIELWEQIEALTTAVKTLQFQLGSALTRAEEVKVLNGGELMWEIQDIQKKFEDARMGENAIISSEPFFTSQFGYKMCLHLCPNGWGSAIGDHISLYINILKGDYDDQLSWPFNQPIILTLMSQNREMNNDVIQFFIPDVSSVSFAKPTTESNESYGVSHFAPVGLLYHRSYVRNDTIYIKANFDNDVVLKDQVM